MSTLATKIFQLNAFIINGDSIKAMELFYADDVTMQENEDLPRIGKRACIENENKNIEHNKVLSTKLLNQAIDNHNNVVFTEWEITFVTSAGKKLRLNEVSVQQWQNEKIVREKFYYKDVYAIK